MNLITLGYNMKLSNSIEDILKEVHASIGESVQRKYRGRLRIQSDVRYVEVYETEKDISVTAELTGLNPNQDGYDIYTSRGGGHVLFSKPLDHVVAFIVSELRKDRRHGRYASNVPSKYLK